MSDLNSRTLAMEICMEAKCIVLNLWWWVQAVQDTSERQAIRGGRDYLFVTSL